jgi:hypothetical protein
MTEYGEVIMSRQFDPDRGRDCCHIDRADPRALIADELLTEIRRGTPFADLDGDVLTIRDDYGQRFIYRIGQFRLDLHAYEMEWPD